MQIFISYSRQQFYFAESVVLYLQKLGHDVWFDVQRLTPGLDWQAGIQQGLEQADILILIASEASIQSPYVRKEWEALQQQNKPVYVLFYEWVDLPADLQPAGVFDLRDDFLRGMQGLRACLDGQQPCQQTIKRGFLEGTRPTRITLMSAAILINVGIAVTMGLTALLYAIAVNAGWGFFWVLIFAAAGSSVRGDWRKFEARQLESPGFFRAMYLIPIIGSFFPLAINTFSISSLAGLSFVIGCFNLLYLRDQFDIKRYHWMPRGAAETSLRYNAHQLLDPTPSRKNGCLNLFVPAQGSYRLEQDWLHWLQAFDLNNVPVPQNGRSIRYSIEAANADQHIADQVDRTMQHFKHVRVKPEEEADQRFYVISNHTSRKMLDRANEKDRHITLVLASSVDLTDEAATRCQIVDYRGRSQRQLNSMARYFALPEQQNVTEFGLSQIPRPFTWFVLPPEIGLLTAGIRGVGILFSALAITILLIAAGVLPVDLMALRGQIGASGVLIALVIGAVGGASIIGADMLAERRIRSRDFVFVSAFFTVLVLALSAWLLVRSGMLAEIARFMQGVFNPERDYIWLTLLVMSIAPLTLRARIWLPVVIEPLPIEQTLRIKTVSFIESDVRNTLFLTILLLAAVIGSQGG